MRDLKLWVEKIWRYSKFMIYLYLDFSCLYYAMYYAFWHKDFKLAVLYIAGAFIFSNEIEKL